MSENSNQGSAFSKVFIGVAIIVIAAIILDMIGINSSGEPINKAKADKSESPVNSSSSSNSGANQTGKQSPSSSTQLNSPNDSESKTNKSKEKDYSSYINASLNSSNVSIAIVDANGNLSTSASSAIADIYRKTGKSTSTGLIRSAFIKKPEFQELWEGNSDVIEKLELKAHTDYLALGRINYSMRSGTLVSGTIICNASISMSIISTDDKSIVQSFIISNINGNGVTESQAQENALQKLLDKYYSEHSSF